MADNARNNPRCRAKSKCGDRDRVTCAVAFFGWFKSLFDNSYTTATPPDDNEFVNGNAALSYCGHWCYPGYSEAMDDNLVLIPQPDLDTGPKTGMGSWNWGITSEQFCPAEEAEGAWAFLEYILQPENILAMANSNGAVPARVSALEMSDNYSEGGPVDYTII